jgi:hypothetical protein
VSGGHGRFARQDLARVECGEERVDDVRVELRLRAASAADNERRYGRSDVIASNASATASTRPSRGIAEPARRVG